jgi:hypothetical protein
VHVIDTVLTVPATPAQTAINTGLTSLAGALTNAGLVGPVNSLTDATIFAPSNDAFEAIGSALGAISSQDFASILGYHVVAQQVRFSTDLLSADQMTLSTLQGQNITVRRDGGQLFVNSARVLIADILTTNGVVHVLDKCVSCHLGAAFGVQILTSPSVLNPSNTAVAPDPAAATQAPAFAGVSSVTDSPFTSGITPTATFFPASVPLNGGAGALAAVPTAALVLAGGAVVLAANL